MADVQPETMTEAEWRALGKKLFGPALDRWRFRCPTCGHVMSIAKAREMTDEQQKKLRGGGAGDQGWSIESECVGRYLSDAGCNWCAYGLFSGPFFVVRPDGHKTPVFGFDAEVAHG